MKRGNQLFTIEMLETQVYVLSREEQMRIKGGVGIFTHENGNENGGSGPITDYLSGLFGKNVNSSQDVAGNWMISIGGAPPITLTFQLNEVTITEKGKVTNKDNGYTYYNNFDQWIIKANGGGGNSGQTGNELTIATPGGGSEMEEFMGMLAEKGLLESIKGFAPKLNSQLEKDLFEKYWYGTVTGIGDEKGIFTLSTNEFSELKKIVSGQVQDFSNTQNIKNIDGINYYIHGVSTYGSEKYDFAIGSALGIYNQTGELIGIYDHYNFDPGNRSWYAETATRTIARVSPITARTYYINAGNIPEELMPYLNSLIN